MSAISDGLRGLTATRPSLSVRAGWTILGLAMAAGAVLLLWLNRGTVFYVDELNWFSDLGVRSDLASIIHPHNSHLHGTTRALYLLIIETIGPQYLVFRLLALASLLLCSGLLFEWTRRRVDPLWALLPSILILVYGSAWQHVAGPIGFTITFSLAAGLAAFLALERDDRKGDLLACAFVCLSVFTFTIGLGFLVGAAIMVLLRPDRLRRLWIFAVPLALFTIWWLWSQQFDQGRASVANVENVIPFFANALAGVSGSLTGVAIPFSRFGEAPDSIFIAPPGPIGWVVAALALVALVLRVRRGSVPASLWGSLGVLGTYWLAAALADPIDEIGSQVDQVRYVLPGTVGVVLVAADVLRGWRPTRVATLVVLAVFCFSFAMNLHFLRDGARYLRGAAEASRAYLGVYELHHGLEPGGEGDRGTAREPDDPTATLPNLFFAPSGAHYLAAVERFGSPANDLDQIRADPPNVRLGADETLLTIGGLTVGQGTRPPERTGCVVLQAEDGPVEVPGGGLLIRPLGAEPLGLAVARFSDPPGVPAVQAAEGVWTSLIPARDPAPDPWRAQIITPQAQATICPG